MGGQGSGRWEETGGPVRADVITPGSRKYPSEFWVSRFRRGAKPASGSWRLCQGKTTCSSSQMPDWMPGVVRSGQIGLIADHRIRSPTVIDRWTDLREAGINNAGFRRLGGALRRRGAGIPRGKNRNGCEQMGATAAALRRGKWRRRIEADINPLQWRLGQGGSGRGSEGSMKHQHGPFCRRRGVAGRGGKGQVR